MSWKEPAKPNGIIRSYQLKYESQDLELANHTGVENVPVDLLEGGVPEYLLEGLVACVPYRVTVSAFTTIGEGGTSSAVGGLTTENGRNSE